MKKHLVALTSAVLLFSVLTTAHAEQAITQSMPLSYSLKSLPESPELNIPALDMAKITKEDSERDSFEKIYRFALAYKAKDSYTQDGQWIDAGDQAIWRLSVNAKDTHNLSFGFKDVFLPAGAQLFVYNKEYSQVIGPFTERNNNSFQELWTPVLLGGEAIIEISVPKKLQRYVTFDLTDINQGYRGIDKVSRAKSGSCNIDVVCPAGDPWRDEIRSVASYSFSSGGNSYVCTGTLMNNTAQDKKPYFLTANHCVSNQTVASTMVFYWNYETSVCAGVPDGSRVAGQTGATLRATWSSSDMTLVEISSQPNANLNVHWAGWDNTAPAPTASVAIHHPAGDEKRISFDNDAGTLTSYLGTTENANGSHIRIGAWEQGTTEGGSSGSAIWNPNHHVVGTLHGGYASCSAPTASDWYGRVSLQWEGGGTSSSQLKHWLDPTNSGVTTLNGTDACTAPTVSIASINPNPAAVGQTVNFSSSVSGGSGSGYTYAWDFDGNGSTDSTAANPSYVYSSAYTGNVSLTVNDSAGCSQSDTAAIVVEVANRAPTAVVAASNITANENTSVSLDARPSSDPDGDALTFAWMQTSGPSITLSGANSALASFTAPDIAAATSLSFEVTVRDPDGLSSTTSVTVNLTVNSAPTASVASANLNVNEGTGVTLNASSSSDPDGDSLTFAWIQTSGTTVAINNASSATASFTAPQVSAATTLEFEVTVTDTSGESDTATVSVTVNDVPAPPPSSGGGGSTGLGLVALLSLLAIRRRRN